MDKEILVVMIWGIVMFICGAVIVYLALGVGKCRHENKIIRTFFTSVTCEETATFCEDCGKQLDEVKTDCR